MIAAQVLLPEFKNGEESAGRRRGELHTSFPSPLLVDKWGFAALRAQLINEQNRGLRVPPPPAHRRFATHIEKISELSLFGRKSTKLLQLHLIQHYAGRIE